jgi:hypothetical protein
LLGGCTSSGLSGIYILSLAYQIPPSDPQPLEPDPDIATTFRNVSANAQLEVRIGFRGMCILQGMSGWLCSPSASDLVSTLKPIGPAADPLGLIRISSNFQGSVIFDGLM